MVGSGGEAVRWVYSLTHWGGCFALDKEITENVEVSERNREGDITALPSVSHCPCPRISFFW